jgi:hypothetical protein
MWIRMEIIFGLLAIVGVLGVFVLETEGKLSRLMSDIVTLLLTGKHRIEPKNDSDRKR